MKQILVTTICALAMIIAPVSAQAQTQTHNVVGVVTGSNSDKRLVYIDDIPYRIAEDARVTSSSISTYRDPLLIAPGTVVRFKWKEENGQPVTNELQVLEGLKHVPE